jgi:amidase
MTLKDAHDVAGLRTTVGAPELDRVAGEDGTVAARLRAAGAVIFGHTNVPPWLADDLQTANPIFGRTGNPWDPGRTPGGSSGGAAAALAAGMTPLEIGSDMTGSVRVPAHFCGVYGLKATEHRVPLTGFLSPPPDVPRPVRIISSLGPLARDLGDLELALRIIAGPDWRDGDVPPVPLGPRPRTPLSDLRLAVAPTLPGATVARAIGERVERVAAEASDAGAQVVDRLPDIDWETALALFVDLVTTITGVFDPSAGLRDEQRTLAWHLDALDRRDRFVAAWQMFFEDVDALILPSAMSTAFTERETGAPIEVDGKTVSYWENGRLVVFSNLTGLPGLTVPAGLDEQGLPMGVQIVGPRWSEMRLLEIARRLERSDILPGFQAPPGS